MEYSSSSPAGEGPAQLPWGTRLEALPNLVWWQLEAILASVPQFNGVASCTILIVFIGVVGIKPVVDIYFGARTREIPRVKSYNTCVLFKYKI